MWSFAALCDDFYVHTRLFFKLDLDPSRESALHFFDRIRRSHPRLTRLRRRDDGGLLLDEEGDERGRRYIRLESASLKFGMSSPSDPETVRRFGDLILGQAPSHLSLSDLDYDYMDTVFVFDLEYRGNHDELIAETLFPNQPLIRALTDDQQRLIDCQPFFGIALTPGCEKQAFVEVKGRTTTYELRSGEFGPSLLSVHLTVRRYWGFGELPASLDVYHDLLELGEHYADERVVPLVVKPLAAAIASRR
jgi:hypothetical protein